MATYILTKRQKEILVEALDDYIERLVNDGSDEIESTRILQKYLDNPYSGSWMGKSNTR